MILGDFGKRTILWGAGLSKAWDGFLANEFWGHLLGASSIRAFARLRTLLAEQVSFERAIEEVTTGEFSDEEKHALWSAVLQVFERQDRSLLEALSPPDPPVDEAQFLRFLSSFKPGTPALSAGYLFTLNQDVLLEAMGSYRAGSRPQCPAVPSSQGAFSHQFRSPLLLPHEMQLRPVPDRVPAEGWPALPGGLHYIKLHGSASWKTAAGNHELVIGGDKTSLIDRSPLLSWYREIFRAVCADGDVRMVIIGYGFRDAHINEILADGIASHSLRLYVVGAEAPADFHRRLDPRILAGLDGYVVTPIANIMGKGGSDTASMGLIKGFLDEARS